jgi:hypothetical protein
MTYTRAPILVNDRYIKVNDYEIQVYEVGGPEEPTVDDFNGEQARQRFEAVIEETDPEHKTARVIMWLLRSLDASGYKYDSHYLYMEFLDEEGLMGEPKDY